VLYGAYTFAEKLGVRFYLDGDVIPDARIPFAIPSSMKPTGRCSSFAASSRSMISPKGRTGGTRTITWLT